MNIIFLVLGILIGAVISWLYFKTKITGGIDDSDLTQKMNDLQNQLLTIDNKYRDADKQKSIAENQIDILQQNFHGKEQEFISEKNSMKDELKTERIKFDAERDKVDKLNERVARAEEVFTKQKEKLAEITQEKEELNKKLLSEFEVIANKILEEKSQKFTDQNKSNLDIILNPLKERIKDFEEKVDKTYKTESTERISLKKEIEMLVSLNKQVSEEANNLSKALKGDVKKQGNWGEIMLEKVLENSGLRKDEEYKTQFSYTDETGSRKQPDVVVMLPDNKHIVVDSKVSLVAYDKNYQNANTLNSPEFVLLFIPIESMFSLAMQADAELFNFAWDRKIVIVSPSTLLATLRTVASVWKQERQTRNAIKIAEESGKLYDKFVGFITDMEKIDKNLNDAKGSYNDAMGKLRNGNGNVIKKVEELKTLGAKTTKAIPEKFLDTDKEI